MVNSFETDDQQAALQAERDGLQHRLTQAEKDLEAAKSASTSTTAAPTEGVQTVTDQERQELQGRVDAAQKDKEEFVQVGSVYFPRTELIKFIFPIEI